MINAYAAFEAKGQLQPYQYDPGELGAFDVEIDVDHCGICHSDVSMLDNDWGRAKYPMVAGHEIIGRVSKLGSHVGHLVIDWPDQKNHTLFQQARVNVIGPLAPTTLFNHHGNVHIALRVQCT